MVISVFDSAVIVFLMHRSWIALLLLVVGMICLFQHRMTRKLAMEDVTNALYAAMPQWMIQMALLLQHNNVQVSIAKSIQPRQRFYDRNCSFYRNACRSIRRAWRLIRISVRLRCAGSTKSYENAAFHCGSRNGKCESADH